MISGYQTDAAFEKTMNESASRKISENFIQARENGTVGLDTPESCEGLVDQILKRKKLHW